MPSSPERRQSWRDRLHAELSRATSSGEFVAEVDGLRFVAIVSVVLFHLAYKLGDPHPLQGVLSTGFVGVQFFFAISGFILARPFLRHHLADGRAVDTRRYLTRRLTRLEPPYLINLVVLTAAGLVEPTTNLVGHFLASATYTHWLFFEGRSPINTVAWSLEVEAQFYLLMPLLAWGLFRVRDAAVRRALLVLACVPALLWQGSTAALWNPPSHTLLDHFQFFAAGILLADLHLDYTSKTPSRGWWPDVVATAGYVAMFGLASVDALWARALVPVAIVAAFHGSLVGVGWRSVFRNRWISAIGGMCYTIYLYHLQILALSLELLPAGGGGLVGRLLFPGGAALAITFVVCALFFVLVEKPFMVWRTRKPS